MSHPAASSRYTGDIWPRKIDALTTGYALIRPRTGYANVPLLRTKSRGYTTYRECEMTAPLALARGFKKSITGITGPAKFRAPEERIRRKSFVLVNPISVLKGREVTEGEDVATDSSETSH